MHITILYFATLREERGKNQETHFLEQPISVATLFESIFSRQAQGMRFAINQVYVDAHTMLSDGDEVAFIPPLGGG